MFDISTGCVGNCSITVYLIISCCNNNNNITCIFRALQWNMFMGALQELYNWNKHEQTEVGRKLTMAPLVAAIFS